MRTFRQERLGSVIQSELNKIIIKEVEFGGALVTLTSVEISKDLDTVTAGISVIPSEKAEDVFDILKKNRSRLQYLLAEKIELRRAPRLIFHIDHGYENAAEVERNLMK